ncbi:hypothetical protein QYF61_012084 [Mycteria americana]|uniref:Uncharacterized protein n=1 Tax=Mycteria americana TaxID=33587 RepID=A0AAN7PQP4_MYCAM|nr:hypothetical protein QYF61_012084 [Mycteria americana]
MTGGLEHVTCKDVLKELSLFSLKKRWIKEDLTCCLQLCNSFVIVVPEGYSPPAGALEEHPRHGEQLGYHRQHANRQESNGSTEAKLLSHAWHSWCHAILKQDRKAIQSTVRSLKADFNLYFGRDRSDTLADFSLRPSCDALQSVFRVVLACLRFVYRQRPISARQSRRAGRVTAMTQRKSLTSNFINWQIQQADKLNKLASSTNKQRRFGNGAIF